MVDDAQSQPVSTIIVEQVAKRLDQLTLAPSPHTVRRLRRRLIQAGFPDDNAPTVYRVIRLMVAVTFPLSVFFIVTVILGWPVNPTTVGVTVLALLYGLFLPSFYLSRMITKRKGRILFALPYRTPWI